MSLKYEPRWVNPTNSFQRGHETKIRKMYRGKTTKRKSIFTTGEYANSAVAVEGSVGRFRLRGPPFSLLLLLYYCQA